MHKFEAAGLGKAPFRVVGVDHRVGPITRADGSQVGAPGQPMGTCDFCGKGIAECWTVRSADGHEFVVGCDCVRKTGDRGMIKRVNAEAARKRGAREVERIKAARASLDDPTVVARLAAQPHPLGRSGETLLDWAHWMMTNAGHAGRMRVVRTIG